jgi:hypothetical protein
MGQKTGLAQSLQSQAFEIMRGKKLMCGQGAMTNIGGYPVMTVDRLQSSLVGATIYIYGTQRYGHLLF